MKILAYSNKGLVRDRNEDIILVGNTLIRDTEQTYYDRNLITVFDGVGGADLGDVTSKESATFFYNALMKKGEVNKNSLTESIYETNLHIVEEKEANNINTATTISGLYFGEENTLYTYNLGDSSVIRFRSDMLLPLTKSDTSPFNKNQITKYIGKSDLKLEDILVEEIFFGYKEDDIFLVTTDGVTDMISLDFLSEIISKNKDDLELIKKEIITNVNKNGALDNFSFALVKVGV